jgi:hypothetical protein
MVLSVPAYVLHPKGMTCLDCGFLALDDREVSTANRVLLGANGEAGCPPLNKLHCTKKLWVSYDLKYFNDSREGIFDELQRRRRPCVGFLLYRPGRSPLEHRALEDKKRERSEKVVIGILSGVGGILVAVVTTWLLKRIGLST